MLRIAAVALLALMSGSEAVKITQKHVKAQVTFAQAKAHAKQELSADDIMEMFDHNEDGVIDEAEFKDQMMAIAEAHDYEPTDEDKEDALAMFHDAAGEDGLVSMDELIAAMNDGGSSSDDDEEEE